MQEFRIMTARALFALISGSAAIVFLAGIVAAPLYYLPL
jgi:hypothetical protein